MQLAGQSESCYTSGAISAIYSPEGACLQSMREGRTKTMPQAYWKTAYPELEAFQRQYLRIASLLDTRMDPNLDHILLQTRTTTLLCQASQPLSSVLRVQRLNSPPCHSIGPKDAATRYPSETMQTLVLTWMHICSSCKAAAIVTQNPQMSRW